MDFILRELKDVDVVDLEGIIDFNRETTEDFQSRAKQSTTFFCRYCRPFVQSNLLLENMRKHQLVCTLEPYQSVKSEYMREAGKLIWTAVESTIFGLIRRLDQFAIKQKR